MNIVNYKVLKDLIRKSCRHNTKPTMEFYIDYNKLAELTEDIGLSPLMIGLESKAIKPDNIPFMSEYFEKSELSWFSEGKCFTTLIFMDIEGLDEEAHRIIERLNKPQVEVPYDDKVHDVAKLVAEYPCYFALVISYQNNDPKKMGRPSYNIGCRANKVIIKKGSYIYNPKDFS